MCSMHACMHACTHKRQSQALHCRVFAFAHQQARAPARSAGTCPTSAAPAAPPRAAQRTVPIAAAAACDPAHALHWRRLCCLGHHAGQGAQHPQPCLSTRLPRLTARLVVQHWLSGHWRAHLRPPRKSQRSQNLRAWLCRAPRAAARLAVQPRGRSTARLRSLRAWKVAWKARKSELRRVGTVCQASCNVCPGKLAFSARFS